MFVGILIFILISVLFAGIRIHSFKKHQEKCVDPSFIIPKKTYFWHISGPFLVVILMFFALYADFYGKLALNLPHWLFSIMTGFLAGVCLTIALIYLLADAGIYENGILTHFIFIELNEIESVEFVKENTLNINSKIKTLKIHLKDQTLKIPSIEYLEKNEAAIRSALENLNIQEG